MRATVAHWSTSRARSGDWDVEIVTRSDSQPNDAFAVPLHRWLVERSVAWWGRLRRLSKTYKHQVDSSEALIYAGMSHLLLRRLVRLDACSSPAG
jgi:transposase